jgi:hypothetical protein
MTTLIIVTFSAVMLQNILFWAVASCDKEDAFAVNFLASLPVGALVIAMFVLAMVQSCFDTAPPRATFAEYR